MVARKPDPKSEPNFRIFDFTFFSVPKKLELNRKDKPIRYFGKSVKLRNFVR